VTGPDVHLENFQLTRSSDVYSVFLDNYGTDGLRLDRMVINGRKDVFPVQYVEAWSCPRRSVRSSSTPRSPIRRLRMSTGASSRRTDPGYHQGFVVDHSTFKHNYADDLEFNAPSATMTEITVTNNSFSDNQYSAPEGAAGVGVGMANAQYVKVAHNTFDGYFYSPIHIEDRSANIDVIDNHFANSFKLVRNYASMVFIINDSHFVTVRHNVFDSSGNTNEVWCVYAGAGGGVAPPSYVTITDNTFLLRPNAHVIGNYDAATWCSNATSCGKSPDRHPITPVTARSVTAMRRLRLAGRTLTLLGSVASVLLLLGSGVASATTVHPTPSRSTSPATARCATARTTTGPRWPPRCRPSRLPAVARSRCRPGPAGLCRRRRSSSPGSPVR